MYAGFALFLPLLFEFVQVPPQPLPSTNCTLFGRSENQTQLINVLKTSSFVTLCGPPGAGKTALTLSTANILLNENYCTVYIDLSEHPNTSALTTYLMEALWCVPYSQYFVEMLRRITIGMSTMRGLQRWGNSLSITTIIILDNVDGDWYKNMDAVQEQFIAPLLSQTDKVKVMAVSRYHFHCNVPEQRCESIYISGIDNESCSDWITITYPQIATIPAKQLCNFFGGIPLAVELAASYVSDLLASCDITCALNRLSSSEFGQLAFTLIDDTYNSRLVRALLMIYENLSIQFRQCAFLLANVPVELTYETVAHYFKDRQPLFGAKCLDKLMSYSLLERVDNHFKFHPFIRSFINWLESPKPDQSFGRTVRYFYTNYIEYHVPQVNKILTENSEWSFQLAVSIGSNKTFVNSMLPILNMKKFNFQLLFKSALKVIKERCCSLNQSKCHTPGSFADVILAYSYLTKAVHCPTLHPVSLILNPKQSKDGHCYDELQSCEKPLENLLRERGNYQTAEAFGYYNMLLVRSSMFAIPPWMHTLFDVSVIITIANDRCKHYCESFHCSCGTESNTEVGLRHYFLRNDILSHRYLELAVSDLNTDSNECQTVLKSIVIMALYITNHRLGQSTQEAMNHLNVNAINSIDLTCYLGVMNDVILPFLYDYKAIQSETLIKQHHRLVEGEDNSCLREASTIEEILDCRPMLRYDFDSGKTALDIKSLQSTWAEMVSDISPRENWICSVIRDKTTKCETILPLLREVRAVQMEDNRKQISGLEFLMDEDELSTLHQKIKQIPKFYHYNF